jgi:hypothetical protein
MSFVLNCIYVFNKLTNKQMHSINHNNIKTIKCISWQVLYPIVFYCILWFNFIVLCWVLLLVNILNVRTGTVWVTPNSGLFASYNFQNKRLLFQYMYRASFVVLCYDQQMHNYFTNWDFNDYNMRTCIKPVWNSLNVNWITDSCIWNTCVTWQGIDCKLSEDDTIVSKHVGVW